MIKKSNIIEIVLISILTLGLILKNYDFKTDYFLYVNLIFLNVFWLIQDRVFNIKVRKFIIIEKEIISITLWLLVMNLCKVPSTTFLFKVSLLILSFFYLVKFFNNRKLAENWFGRQEPMILFFIFLSFFFQFMHYPGSGVLKVLSFLYYIIAVIIFGFKNNIRRDNEYRYLKNIILISNMSISIMLISILFRSMYWPNSRIIFWYGLFLTFFIGYLLFLQYLKKEKKTIIISQTLKRMYKLILITVVLFSYFMVNYARLDFGNRPELIDSYIDCKFNKHFDRNAASCKKFKKLNNDLIDNKIPEIKE